MSETNGNERQMSERDPRQAFLEQTADDFTYKAKFTNEQSAMWEFVKVSVADFHGRVEDRLRQIPSALTQQPLVQTDEYIEYGHALQNAERWFNTAIANDWETGNPVALKHEIDPVKYKGPSGGEAVRHQICDYISEMCFVLMMTMAARLPTGRALSVARTQMQEVRGWLLDTVNENWIEA